MRPPMRPEREELAPLCETHTHMELAALYGVTDRTMYNWCRADGVMPAYRCKLCGCPKRREEFVNQVRCRECAESVAAGTFDGLRICTECGKEKHTSQFYLTSSGIGFRSTCKTCQKKRWAEHAKRKRLAHGCPELPLPATPGRLVYYGVQPDGYAFADGGSALSAMAAESQEA